MTDERKDRSEGEGAGRTPGVFDQAFLTGVEDVTEVLLIRHAQQVAADPSAVAGDWIDPPLSDEGRLQARLLGEALSTTRLDAIIVSPLKRALETAGELARHHRLPAEVVRDLREVEVFRDVPPDKTVSDFLGLDVLKAARQRMLNERKWDVYPSSESSYDFSKRVINAVEALIARNLGERIAIVCHGGVINAYAGYIIGTPYDMFFRPAHTSINVVAVGRGRRVIRLLNDIHHLRTGEGDFSSY